MDLSITVTHWSPHDLRRTVRTILASLGCPRDVGEVMLGHVLGGVEGTYNRHSYDKERRYWIAKLDTHLEQLAVASSVHEVTVMANDIHQAFACIVELICRLRCCALLDSGCGEQCACEPDETARRQLVAIVSILQRRFDDLQDLRVGISASGARCATNALRLGWCRSMPSESTASCARTGC